jgi:endoribonuclease Nob1
MIFTRFRTAIDSGKLLERTPSDVSLAEVDKSSEVVGDIRFLSEADKQVLALAIELKRQGEEPLVVTDDYSIQNVSNQLGLEFAPLMTFGIRYRLNWIIYCPACHRQYPADYKLKTCQVCGTEVKRKPLRKTPLH